MADSVEDALSLEDYFDYPGCTLPYDPALPPWSNLPLPRLPRVGSFVLPWGASRFGVAHVLMTDNQLARVRPLVYGKAGGQWNALDFVMDDGRPGRSITTSLYMLPPRPLDQIAKFNGVYAALLVDERFRWWEKAGVVEVRAGVTTWDQLFAAIATLLGVTITTDPVAAAYLKPNAAFAESYQALPPLLDAALAAVGQRLVRQLDGTLTAQSPRTAKASQDEQLAAFTKDRGGQFLFDAAAKTNDLTALAPAQVTLAFPDVSGGTTSDLPFVEPVTLASLALPEYAAVAGHDGTRVLRSTAAYDGSNGPQLLALAQQAATDWYLWRLAREWVRFIGLDPYEPEAMSDHVEWVSREDTCATWVRRGPQPEWELGHLGSAGAVSPGPDPPICKPVAFAERDTRCEGSTLNVYTRAVTIETVSGCPSLSFGPWLLSHGAGCCDCSPPIKVVNVTDITTVTVTGPQLFFNQADLKLWFWDGTCWIAFCPSLRECPSGSPPPPPCTPGECPPCADPPYAWQFGTQEFSGGSAAFNGNWVLYAEAYDPDSSSCVWTGKKTFAGLPVLARFTLHDGTWQLQMEYINADNVTVGVSYSHLAALPECCCPVTVDLDACQSAVETCDTCAPGITPTSASAFLTDATGCFVPFGGAWSLIPDEASCSYRADRGLLQLVVDLVDDGAGHVIVTAHFSDAALSPPALATYRGTMTSGVCCVPVDMALAADPFCFDPGSMPATFVLNFQCDPRGGACPPQITLAPQCCLGEGDCDIVPSGSDIISGPGGGGVVTPCCPAVALPLTLHATVEVLSGDTCWAGTYLLENTNPTVDPAGGSWSYSDTSTAPCGGLGLEFDFGCNPGLDKYTFGGGVLDGSSFLSETPSASPPLSSCGPPFVARFDPVMANGVHGAVLRVKVTF